MELSKGRTRLAKVVRRHVKVPGTDKTCIGCVRVLEEVLVRKWKIRLTPCVIDPLVLPPETLQILGQPGLSEEEKNAKISELPAGQKPIRMQKNEDSNFEAHVIGVSSSEKGYFVWDPSFDQFNEKKLSRELEPFCIELNQTERREIEEDEGPLELKIPLFECLLLYREAKHLECKVFNSELWNLDYSSEVEAVLSEVETIPASSFF